MDANDATQRRVYVLPTELVERIIAFQNEIGLASEVEAARRLLDEALKQRDTVLTIVGRLVAQFKTVRSLREAAREVLVDHPLVTKLAFDPLALTFALADGHSVEVDAKGTAAIKDEFDSLFDFGQDVPEWASSDHPRPRKMLPSAERKSMSDQLDDDIPF